MNSVAEFYNLGKGHWIIPNSGFGKTLTKKDILLYYVIYEFRRK
jgi:hypothetical protein